MTRSKLGSATCLLILGLFAVTAASGQDRGSTVGPAIDENLFMLRLLDEYYAEIPGSETVQGELATKLEATKQEISGARRVVQAEGLDRDLDALYADAIRLVDTYQGYLAALGVIENSRSKQAIGDTLSTLWDSYQFGKEARSTATDFGVSKENAQGLGNFAGIVDAIFKGVEKSQQRDAAQAVAIQAQRNSLMEAWSAIRHRASLAADMLSHRYGWLPGEAGFDGFSTQYFEEYLKRRPRDPFLIARYANTRKEGETSGDILNDANRCLVAAKLVPARPAFSAIRNDYVENAAELAATAASKEANNAYSAHPRLAPAVVSAAQYYLNLDPGDPSGRGHMVLARGLAFSGHYREAVEAATATLNSNRTAWGNDPTFCYRYAMYLSLAGDRLDLVSAWLQQAYANGLTWVKDVRSTPDLRNFRATYPAEFSRLTQQAITARVKFGILLDDLILENHSPFEITNVKSVVTIQKGQTTWKKSVNCASVLPGGSCIFENAVSIPDDTFDTMSATVECDQCSS
jgi:hypothetical protein